jgi:hypothetical protein
MNFAIIAWETFHTLGSIPVYGEATPVFHHGVSTVLLADAARDAACCVPKKSSEPSCAY